VVAKEAISFQITSPAEPGATYTVRGTLLRPASAGDCARSVLLLLHGLSYGEWAWDFPVEPERYSTARALAADGYPTVALDLLGYGSSDHPSGRTLTVESYAAVTRQIIDQLRAGSYT
jgi:pimeloyl-ACP methyl ester carboxylesterase